MSFGPWRSPTSAVSNSLLASLSEIPRTRVCPHNKKDWPSDCVVTSLSLSPKVRTTAAAENLSVSGLAVWLPKRLRSQESVGKPLLLVCDSLPIRTYLNQLLNSQTRSVLSREDVVEASYGSRIHAGIHCRQCQLRPPAMVQLHPVPLPYALPWLCCPGKESVATKLTNHLLNPLHRN